MACLFAVIPICASGEQRDQDDGFPVEVCCRLKIADASAMAEHGASIEDAANTDIILTTPLPIEAGTALDLSLQEILDNAERVVERFNRFRLESDLFLGLDADMDDRVIHRSGMLVRNMSMLIGEIREANNGAALETLSQQSVDIQAAGIRLFLAASRLDLLMQEHGRCGLRNLGLLLSAVEALALELEDNLTGSGQPIPELHYFFYPKHHPNVVPLGGDWLILVGAGLWKNGTPQVVVVDHHRGRITGPLEVQRAGPDQAAAVRTEPEWITANAGRCLWLNVGDNTTSDPLRQQHAKPAAGKSLPLCIPLSFGTQYKIAGFLEYRTPTRTNVHKAKSMLFENASCKEGKQVSASLEWELNPGGWLTDTGESTLYEAGSTSIDCEISENRIICQGHLGPAVCGQDLHSGNEQSLLLEQSEWEHIFTPTEEYPEEETHRSWSLSKPVDLDQWPVQLELAIPREEPSEETTIWYELIMVNGGQQSTVFVSPKQTLTGTAQVSHIVGHDRITAEFTVEPDAAAAEIDISIESTACQY